MKYLLIGAAVVALAMGPIAAQGNGNGNGKGQAGGHGKAEHGPSMKAPPMKPSMKPEQKGPTMQAGGHGNSSHARESTPPAMKPATPRHGNGKAHAADKSQRPAQANAERGRSSAAHADKAPSRAAPSDNGRRNGPNERASGNDRPGVRVLEDGRRYYTERGARGRFEFSGARLGPIDGCPPGLAKKYNGCMPPGLARQRLYRPDWWGLAGLAGGSYAYDEGYLLRLDGARVAGYVPLLGGALSPGNIWPSMYAPVAVPDYYADYYDLGPPGGYRYADDVLYRVDPSTSAITSIAALLTGDDFQIGSPLPAGYDVYNVPYAFRGQYRDGPDARYRYSDGYIYQVDPTTRLVTAAIDLLAG